ncbi:Hypothetical predicted protein, partial [Pelobates cultripes]
WQLPPPRRKAYPERKPARRPQAKRSPRLTVARSQRHSWASLPAATPKPDTQQNAAVPRPHGRDPDAAGPVKNQRRESPHQHKPRRPDPARSQVLSGQRLIMGHPSTHSSHPQTDSPQWAHQKPNSQP